MYILNSLLNTAMSIRESPYPPPVITDRDLDRVDRPVPIVLTSSSPFFVFSDGPFRNCHFSDYPFPELSVFRFECPFNRFLLSELTRLQMFSFQNCPFSELSCSHLFFFRFLLFVCFQMFPLQNCHFQMSFWSFIF